MLLLLQSRAAHAGRLATVWPLHWLAHAYYSVCQTRNRFCPGVPQQHTAVAILYTQTSQSCCLVLLAAALPYFKSPSIQLHSKAAPEPLIHSTHNNKYVQFVCCRHSPLQKQSQQSPAAKSYLSPPYKLSQSRQQGWGTACSRGCCSSLVTAGTRMPRGSAPTELCPAKLTW
jgi:hypothetical protein